MRSVLRSLKGTYLTVDPRSLGLFRIGFGLVLLWDLFRRYQQLDFFYTNSGLLPNHTLLWRPPAAHVFSLFFVASSREEASLGFGLCALAYAAFTLGYRTRVMQLAALVCRVSLNSRLAVLENGGDMVINLLCIFSCALPLGRRFSLDAWRAAQDPRAQRDVPEPALAPGGTAGDAPELRKTGRSGPSGDSSATSGGRDAVSSLAMLALILQFATIYFFNAVSKQGPAWREGLAVYYALHQDKFVTALGVWMRGHLSLGVFKALTFGVLGVEWTLFVLIITPFFTHRARALAVLMLPMLHLCFALGLNLGTFSPAMMSFFPLLLTSAHWEGVGRWLERFAARGKRPSGRLRALGAALGAVLSRAGAPVSPAPRVARFLTEAAVAVVMAAVVTEALNDNTSVPPALRVHQPAWAKAVIEYPRLLQGWRMFAPEPPRTDAMIYVDATTASGAHVDPYNKVASRQAFPAGDVIPERMDQSQFFTMYSDRIAMPEYAAYRQAFLEWLLAYPTRTGQASDCLTSFQVFWVSDQTPEPGPKGGAAHPKPLERKQFMQYSAPWNDPCKALSRQLEPQAMHAVRQR